MEDFVPYELAVKLKEKGFVHNYNLYGHTLIYSNINTIKLIWDTGAYEREYFGENIPCPTISQVLAWLHQSYHILISVEPIVNRSSISISIYSIDSDDCEPVWMLVHMIFYDNDNEIYDPIRGLELGIEYVLDNNLIKKNT